MVSGRPAYMAPEQVNSQGLGTPDVLTDVYGLGGILFEILYDNPPNGKQSAPIPELLINDACGPEGFAAAGDIKCTHCAVPRIGSDARAYLPASS